MKDALSNKYKISLLAYGPIKFPKKSSHMFKTAFDKALHCIDTPKVFMKKNYKVLFPFN